MLRLALGAFLLLAAPAAAQVAPGPLAPEAPGAAASGDPVTVVVLGSSNAAGVGTSHPDSAWAARLERALPRGSRVFNLARGGYTTYHLLPTGAEVAPEAVAPPDPARNVTAALAHEPDAVVISLTSNDAARGVPVERQLANYRAILQASGAVPVWVTTPTPRTEAIAPEGRAIQAELREATMREFARPVDIWRLVATSDGAPAPEAGAGDGIHYNDRAHRLIAAEVRRALGDLPARTPHPVWDVERGWSAPWHAAADLAPADSQNVWTAHRATFTLDTVPPEALARIAVDSKYWLWVNGALVVREGGLKRGPMRGATYADRVDLAPHLREGTNTLAVLAWYWGKEGFSHASSGRPGLLVDLGVGGEPVPLAWRARRHPAYGGTGPPHPNYRLPESNVRYDAREALAGWTEPGYDDGAWPLAVDLAPAGALPWGPLVARPIPQWRDFGLRPYVDAPALPFTASGDTVVVRLPYNAQVTPALDVTAPAPAEIEVRTDAYIDGRGRTVRAEYVARGGRQAWEAPGWMHGHAVRYAIPAGVTVHGLSFRETGYDAAFTGAFGSSDAALDTLWQKAARTLYVTMRDTYMDTPGRERAQWWGDVVLEMGEAFYALDRRADALARKGILELAAWQRADSTLYSPVPSGPLWSAELPTQMLASVGHYGFWTYVLQSGDVDTARRVYPAVRDYLALWETDARGLVRPRQGGWLWGDWGANKDMPLLFNGWYALALRGQRELARHAGHHADVPAIEAKLHALGAAFDEAFWAGAAYRSPGHAGPPDDRGNALAIVAGLAPPARYPALREVLRRQRHASPYFEKYVAEALIRMGHTGDALARLKDRYASMIASPLTTLWEGWELDSATYGGGTANHAWSGGPLTLFSRYVAGVDPVEPGYRVVRIAPHLGPLAHARAVVPSVRGEVVADARQSPEAFTLEATVPEGVTALVSVPVDGRATLRANGAPVWTRGGISPEASGARVLAAEGGRVLVEVGAGLWRFRAE